MARRLGRQEGLFAGTSSGANVVEALRTAERMGPGSTIVTILCDSGLRYLSTELYRPEKSSLQTSGRPRLQRPGSIQRFSTRESTRPLPAPEAQA